MLIAELFKDTDDYIEIREISDKGINQKHFTPKNINTYIPPQDANVYFGVYARENKNSGKAAACTTTKALWCDIDDFKSETITTKDKVIEVNEKIEAAKLPKPSITVDSGNGVHLYWILEDRANKDIREINKAIAIALGGDIRATDKARVLRLPNTNNVKEKDNIKRCQIVEFNSNKQYKLKDFKNLAYNSIGQGKQTRNNAFKSLENVGVTGISPDRPCIAKILKGVPAGERNFALGRLTKWLQIKGYNKSRARGIILSWNDLNAPAEQTDKLINDFNKYWEEDYKLLGCTINNANLQQLLYRYCDRVECNLRGQIGQITLDNNIRYNNRLLSDIEKLTGNVLIVYGLLVRHNEGLTTSELIEKMTSRATGKPCMSKQTRVNALQQLDTLGYIETIKGNARQGIENLYKARPQGTYGLGYTLVSGGALNGAIDKRVTSGELVLYVLLLKYAYRKGSCYPSIDTLAKDLGTSRNYISKTLRSLEKNDYIKRKYTVINGVENLDIRLLM